MFCSKSLHLVHRGNLQCKSKGQADRVSAGAFQDSRECYILPSLDCGKVRRSSTSEPSTTQRDHRKILLNFMKFSQLFYLTLLCWRVALTDYRCKTIRSALAVRQLVSQFASEDTYVTFLLNSFLFLKMLKPFLTSSWSCYWNVRIFFTLQACLLKRIAKCFPLCRLVDCVFQDSVEIDWKGPE